jgi:hypothetical protein
MAETRTARYALRTPQITFLWHPDTKDVFSCYGLVLGPGHLVGLVMVDRPEPVDPAWLAVIEQTFDNYQLVAMTQSGERGLVCQMLIAQESIPHPRVLPHPHIEAQQGALIPLLGDLPIVTLALTWSPENHCWVSQIVDPRVPLFPLGLIVGTQGAVRALEDAGQGPQVFLDRHVHGDWGEVTDADKRENAYAVQHGFRILSAYTTNAGERIWVLTEADRSATTFMLPEEY